jgi:opacity protein-like surface antigen
MKTFALWTAISLLSPTLAIAQDAQEPYRPPLARADVHFVAGWQNVHQPVPRDQDYGNDWMNRMLFGGAGAGWYWTDHLKTEVDVGAGTEGQQTQFETSFVNGRTTTSWSRVSLRRESMAVAQHYQFFRNQMFHPYVGAGVDIARQTTTERYESVFDVANSSFTQPRTEPPQHRITVRPLAELGFKAYANRRTFFTAGVRLMFKDPIDEVLLRCGFGVDF